MPLQAAERMAAHTGPWARCANELKAKHFAEGSDFLSSVVYETGRSRDFLTAAQILMGIWSLPTHIKFNTPALDKWLQSPAGPNPEFNTCIDVVFGDLSKVFKSPDFKDRRVSPIEFVMLAVLLYQHREKTDQVKVQRASQFRARLRAKFVDLRINSKVITFAWTVLDDLLLNNPPMADAPLGDPPMADAPLGDVPLDDVPLDDGP